MPKTRKDRRNYQNHELLKNTVKSSQNTSSQNAILEKQTSQAENTSSMLSAISNGFWALLGYPTNQQNSASSQNSTSQQNSKLNSGTTKILNKNQENKIKLQREEAEIRFKDLNTPLSQTKIEELRQQKQKDTAEKIAKRERNQMLTIPNGKLKQEISFNTADSRNANGKIGSQLKVS